MIGKFKSTTDMFLTYLSFKAYCNMKEYELLSYDEWRKYLNATIAEKDEMTNQQTALFHSLVMPKYEK